jgi:deoxyribose-phosphate aldolase
VRACEAAEKAGARFVKTSTGFGTGGATAEDVRLLRKAVGDRLQVKASGGVRSYHDAIRMLDAGADRIGASSSIAIISELPE